jgi:hypothetical protein
MNNLEREVNQKRESERKGLSADWQPSDEAIKLARERRISVSGCAAKFRSWAQHKTISDVDSRFLKWLMYEKPPMDGESDADYEPQINYRPTAAELDRAAFNFARNNSFWGAAMGPEPGMTGCKCPDEILLRHGIDPKTGLVRRWA